MSGPTDFEDGRGVTGRRPSTEDAREHVRPADEPAGGSCLDGAQKGADASEGSVSPGEHPREPALDGASVLTTGDMARLSGSTLRTVRFYEQEGLVRPIGRSDGGHRHFRTSELQKLQLALDLREAGLSLQAIKELFELKRDACSPEDASMRMSDLLESQIADMQRRIAKLRRLREELASMVSVISECRVCSDEGFPVRCNDCEVLQQPELPRALRVLWSG